MYAVFLFSAGGISYSFFIELRKYHFSHLAANMHLYRISMLIYIRKKFGSLYKLQALSILFMFRLFNVTCKLSNIFYGCINLVAPENIVVIIQKFNDREY